MKVQILLLLYWNFEDAVTKLDTNYTHDRLLKVESVTNKFTSKYVNHYCNFTATQVPLGSFRQ